MQRLKGIGVSPGFPGLSHAGYRQASAIHDYVEALCKAAGSSLSKVGEHEQAMAAVNRAVSLGGYERSEEFRALVRSIQRRSSAPCSGVSLC